LIEIHWLRNPSLQMISIRPVTNRTHIWIVIYNSINKENTKIGHSIHYNTVAFNWLSFWQYCLVFIVPKCKDFIMKPLFRNTHLLLLKFFQINFSSLGWITLLLPFCSSVYVGIEFEKSSFFLPLSKKFQKTKL
jgi:hypothetical protein